MHLVFVCSFVCILLASGVQAYSFDVCKVGGVTPPIQPTSVKLEPSTPRIGDTAVFKIEGTYEGAEVASGKVTAQTFSVNEMFGQIIKVPLITELSKLCDHVKCAMTAGDIDFEYTRELPLITPPGKYLVKVVAKDEKNKPLLCVDLTFEIKRKFLPAL